MPRGELGEQRIRRGRGAGDPRSTGLDQRMAQVGIARQGWIKAEREHRQAASAQREFRVGRQRRQVDEVALGDHLVQFAHEQARVLRAHREGEEVIDVGEHGRPQCLVDRVQLRERLGR